METKVQVGIMAEKIDNLIEVVGDINDTVIEVRDTQRDQTHYINDIVKRVDKIEPIVGDHEDIRKGIKWAAFGFGSLAGLIATWTLPLLKYLFKMAG